ncbi:hypothetical protein GCM10023322_83010 [Rugosimonospora acidiphila]|uniref:ThiF family protein n=2 Tax=Rugosimonospora acidiphila TaxID=556531 RepID=A0ABP9STV9_9ACTN
MTSSITDTFDRTALLGVHEGTRATVTAALDAQAKTGMVIVATGMPFDLCGQAALCTAVATAVRAFGKVIVVADGPVELTYGPYRGLTIAEMTEREGAEHTDQLDPSVVPAELPFLHLGDPPAEPGGAVRIRASWDGWNASVSPAEAGTGPSREGNVVAAIAAAALGVHEAFGTIRERPGSDVGWRTITLNLWQPGTDIDGPTPTHAPAAWWLVGLGHLGQAYAWVLSWLPYADPAKIEIVLQDIQRVVQANHSTGLLTPASPAPIRKTRLAATALEQAGYDVVILDRRLDETSRAQPEDYHVALLGVDTLQPRRLISQVGWKLAIDAGLGIGPADFNAMILYRFPAKVPSDQLLPWNNDAPRQRRATTAALAELEQRDPCGSVELAGTAVGAAFVGAITACLAIAQGVRGVQTEDGFDVINLHLQSGDAFQAPATGETSLPAARLLPLQLSNLDGGLFLQRCFRRSC